MLNLKENFVRNAIFVENRNMQLLPNLNPLRFFFAVLVIIYHVPFFFENRGLAYYDGLPIFHRGAEAVYGFFTLSGFLIIRLLYLEKINTGNISIKNFYVRRVLRIFPLYFLVLIGGMLYYNVFLEAIGIPYKPDGKYNIFHACLMYVFFIPNIAREVYRPGGILEILWSIGIEEQFYLVIAPALTIIKSRFFIPLLVLVTLGYFLIFAGDIFPFLKEYNFLYFYFSAGGLIAILQEKFSLASKIPLLLKGMIICLFIGYFFTDIFVDLSEGTYHLIGMLLFSFFILCISYEPLFIIKNRFLNYLGKISYGIYMYHAFLMQLVGFIIIKLHKKIILSDLTIILLSYVLVIIATLIVSHFSYQYFEKRFLKLKSKYR